MTTVRQARVNKARDAIHQTFIATRAGSGLNPSVMLPVGLDLGPYYDAAAEAVLVNGQELGPRLRYFGGGVCP